MKHLLSISELSTNDIEQIFYLARTLKNGYQPSFPDTTLAYSFEGNSLRTRATFLKAMASLGITSIEVPNLLKTKEDKKHLAGAGWVQARTTLLFAFDRSKTDKEG